MELDNYPDIGQFPMDCVSSLSNGRFLLSNSSSSQVTYSKQGLPGKPSDYIRNDPTPLSSLVPKVNVHSGDVISKIEDMLQHMVECIIGEKKELVLHLKSRMKPGDEVLDEASGAVKCSPTMETRTIRFPGKSAQEAWKFSMSKYELVQVLAEPCTAALLRILELCHEALVVGVVTTKRSLSSSSPVSHL
jgi:hypothetical protein